MAQNFFGFDSGQSVTFTVLLHLGTLAAVCIMYRRDVWMIIKGFFTLVGKLFTGRLRREGLESGERLFSAAGAGHAAAAARRAAGKLCGKPFGRNGRAAAGQRRDSVPVG